MQAGWDEKKLRWMRTAGAYTGYNRRLAAEILAHIPAGGTLCDLGCGAGLLAMELSPRFARTVCVDWNGAAAAFVREEAARRGLMALEMRHMDAAALTERFGTVLTVLHGRAEDIAGPYLALAEERLVAVINSTARGNIGPEGYRSCKRTTPEQLSSLLRERGLRFAQFPLLLEHGQPFPNRAEAADFVETYCTAPPASAVAAYLDTHLVETGDPAFPLYLPNAKRLTVFVVER